MLSSLPKKIDSDLFELACAGGNVGIGSAKWYVRRWDELIQNGANPTICFFVTASVHQSVSGPRTSPPLSSLEIALATWPEHLLRRMIHASSKQGQKWDQDVIFPGLTCLALGEKLPESAGQTKADELAWNALKKWQSSVQSRCKKPIGLWEVVAGWGYIERPEFMADVILDIFPKKSPIQWQEIVKSSTQLFPTGGSQVIALAGALLGGVHLSANIHNTQTREMFRRMETYILKKTTRNSFEKSPSAPKSKM